MLSRLKKSNGEGFTIIEVMIVLAIAGLILLIVFLAVPALQRNSRNTQRKNDAGHVASLISEYESNNSGSNPGSFDFVTPVAAGELDATKENFSIIDKSANLTIAAIPSPLPASPAADKVIIYTKATCTAGSPTPGTSTRQIAVWYGLEGTTATACVTAG